jgi:hypothetical protein
MPLAGRDFIANGNGVIATLIASVLLTLSASPRRAAQLNEFFTYFQLIFICRGVDAWISQN